MTEHPTEQPTEPAVAKAPQSRRGLAMTTILLLVSAAALWSASRMTWVEYTAADGLRPAIDATLSGAEWAPALTPLALLLVAGIAAMFAVRGWWVRLIGVLLALAGVAAAMQGAAALVGDTDRAQVLGIAELSAGTEVTAAQMLAMPAALTIAAGLLAVIAAAPLILGKYARLGLSSSYETPAVRKEAAAESVAASDGGDLEQRHIWDALDAGADPTDEADVLRDHPGAGDTRSNS